MYPVEGTGQQIPKLSADNYHNWKFDIKMALIGRDLWDIVTGGEILEENANAAARSAYRKRDNKALSIICLSIMPDLKIYVRSAKTSKEAWDALSNHFEEKNAV